MIWNSIPGGSEMEVEKSRKQAHQQTEKQAQQQTDKQAWQQKEEQAHQEREKQAFQQREERHGNRENGHVDRERNRHVDRERNKYVDRERNGQITTWMNVGTIKCTMKSSGKSINDVNCVYDHVYEEADENRFSMHNNVVHLSVYIISCVLT